MSSTQDKRRRFAAETDAQLSDLSPLTGIGSTLWKGLSVSQPADVSCLRWKLAVSSGWMEYDPHLQPPAFQAHVAKWLRHKLAVGCTAAGPGLTGCQEHGVHRAIDAVPVLANTVGGSADEPDGDHHHHQQQHHQQQLTAGSFIKASTVQQQHLQAHELNSPPHLSAFTLHTSSSQHQQQHHKRDHSQQQPQHNGSPAVLEFLSGDVLSLVSSSVSSRQAGGSRGIAAQLLMEIQDVRCSTLAVLEPETAPDGMPATSLAGCSGVLLLVSGPEIMEVTAALNRLDVILRRLSSAVAVPLAVLACSGEQLQQLQHPWLGGSMQVFLCTYAGCRCPGFLMLESSNLLLIHMHNNWQGI